VAALRDHIAPLRRRHQVDQGPIVRRHPGRNVEASGFNFRGPATPDRALFPAARATDVIAEGQRGCAMTEVSIDRRPMIDQILDVVATEGMIPREKLQDDATIDSLGLKSIDIVMILTAIEEKFDVYIPMDGSLQGAKDLKGLIAAISAHFLKEKAAK
jgi:acyl carrier protein